MREVTDESTVVAFAGNGHRQPEGVQSELQCLSALGVTRLHHTDDFGIWSGADSRRFTQRINDFAEDAKIIVTVTPGNHEDGKLVSAVFAAVGSRVPASIRLRLAVLSRGYRWSQAGRTCVWFGGAASIDCESCQVGCTWFLGKLPPRERPCGAYRERSRRNHDRSRLARTGYPEGESDPRNRRRVERERPEACRTRSRNHHSTLEIRALTFARPRALSPSR